MAITRFISAFQNKFKTFFKSSSATLKNILVLVLVFGLERIFEKDVFKCPRRKYFLYGSLFLFGPAVCLFSLTLLLNTKFWEYVTGCHLNRFRLRWVIRRISSIIIQAFLPAGVWIVVALVQTNYYVCARLGPKEAALQRAVKDANETKITKDLKIKIEELFSEAETESHIIAWFLFVSLIVFAFIIVCIKRCWFRRADRQLFDIEDYDKLEAEAASDYLKEEMERVAKEEGIKFVDYKMKEIEEREKKRNWVSEVLEEVSEMYPRMTGNLSQPYRAELDKNLGMANKHEVEPNGLQETFNGVIESAL